MFIYVELEYLSDNNELNQISFHDEIVRKRGRVKIDRPMKQEYEIADQDASLRGRPLNATLTWNIMPKVGVSLLSVCTCHPRACKELLARDERNMRVWHSIGLLKHCAGRRHVACV